MVRKNVMRWSVLLGGVLLMLHPGLGRAQNADNTKINERDRENWSETADGQGQSQSDLQITQAVRKAILRDSSLSTNAHNVKIVAKDGVVTLKGPVESPEEARAVGNAAAGVVGAGRVQSQVDIITK